MIYIFAFIGILVCVWLISDLLSNKSLLKSELSENNKAVMPPKEIQQTSQLKDTVKESDENTFQVFKATSTTSQKDAVLYFLVFISSADAIINQNEKRYIEGIESYLYEGIDLSSQVGPQNLDEMLEVANHFTSIQKRFLVQLMCGLVSTNLPIKANKAERIGYIVERIGISETEFESILHERINKNAVLGKL